MLKSWGRFPSRLAAGLPGPTRLSVDSWGSLSAPSSTLADTVDNLRKISLSGQLTALLLGLSLSHLAFSCSNTALVAAAPLFQPNAQIVGAVGFPIWAVLSHIEKSVSLSTLCAGLDTEVTTPRLFSLYPDSGPRAGIVFSFGMVPAHLPSHLKEQSAECVLAVSQAEGGQQPQASLSTVCLWPWRRWEEVEGRLNYSPGFCLCGLCHRERGPDLLDSPCALDRVSVAEIKHRDQKQFREKSACFSSQPSGHSRSPREVRTGTEAEQCSLARSAPCGLINLLFKGWHHLQWVGPSHNQSLIKMATGLPTGQSY